MKYLKTFWYIFTRSLADREYYRDVMKAPITFSIKYLYLFAVISAMVGVVMMGMAVFVSLPKIQEGVKNFKVNSLEAYPIELVIKIENGELTSNVPEPYHISPFKMKSEDYDHFITIDTKANVEDYRASRSIILLTRNAAVYPDNNTGARKAGVYQVYEFNRIQKPLVLDYTLYKNIIAKIEPLVNMIPLFVVGGMILFMLFAPFIGGAVVFMIWLVQLLVLSLVPWLISKLFKNNYSYRKVYQLGLHALTLPAVATNLLLLFNYRQSFLFSGIFLLWMSIILAKLSEDRVREYFQPKAGSSKGELKKTAKDGEIDYTDLMAERGKK